MKFIQSELELGGSLFNMDHVVIINDMYESVHGKYQQFGIQAILSICETEPLLTYFRGKHDCDEAAVIEFAMREISDWLTGTSDTPEGRVYKVKPFEEYMRLSEEEDQRGGPCEKP